jgi:hypothetical protein
MKNASLPAFSVALAVALSASSAFSGSADLLNRALSDSRQENADASRKYNANPGMNTEPHRDYIPGRKERSVLQVPVNAGTTAQERDSRPEIPEAAPLGDGELDRAEIAAALPMAGKAENSSEKKARKASFASRKVSAF